jgi:hypothetical protein
MPAMTLTLTANEDGSLTLPPGIVAGLRLQPGERVPSRIGRTVSDW